MAIEAHRARKRFGQNFLQDSGVAAQIVEAIDPRPGQLIVEIGPGQAALTSALVERTGHIVAIEIDRDLAARLRQRFLPERLTLIEADALKADWNAIATAPLRITGNLPYNISTPLLFALLPIADRVIDQHFMLQKEVVDRMVAAPGSRTYGRLSVMLQFRYRLMKLFDVPSTAFRPAPQVTSSLVRMLPRAATSSPPSMSMRLPTLWPPRSVSAGRRCATRCPNYSMPSGSQQAASIRRRALKH